MTTVYINQQNCTLRLDAETLVLKIPADPDTGREAQKKRVQLGKVSQVVVQGNSTITTPAIGAIIDQRADICYLTRYGKFIARIIGDEHKHSRLRLMQGRAHDDPDARLHVALACVRAKLHNQRTLLLRGNRTRDDKTLVTAAETIRHIIEQVDALPRADIIPPDPLHPQTGTVLGSLMGLEGAAAAAYFEGYGRLFTGKWQGHWTGRHKRPPTDPINALLSYGYTLLTSQMVAAAHIVGFDPYIGYLHSTQYGRPALALDIMEMFRAPIVDSVVLTMLNNRMLTPDDFEETLGAWRLTDAGRRLFLQKFEERLNEEIVHPVLQKKVSYRRALELQMRLLSRWLLSELKRFREFYTR